MPRQKLLTKEIARRLPMLYTNEETPPDDQIVQVKFFEPWGSWTWYATEAAGVKLDGTKVPLRDVKNLDALEDVLFFGAVDGFELEWGYFTLNELKAARGPGPFRGLGIERDAWWTPKKFGDINLQLRM